MSKSLESVNWRRELTSKVGRLLRPSLLVQYAMVLALWPALMVIPFGIDASLDGSWPEVLLYAHLKGWQFGSDIVFTWGPWGFLNNQFHLGASGAGVKILWETVGKLGIAAALVTLTRRPPIVWQTMFALCCILFSWLFLDTIFLVLITLIVIGGLMSTNAPRWQQVLWVVVLALLGQIKFTYMLFAAGGVTFAALLFVLRRNYATALRLCSGYGFAFLLFWIAAGQNPANLPAYLLQSLEISLGYGWAMGIDETNPVFLSCLSLALFSAFFVYRFWKTIADRPFAWAAVPYLACTWFVVWKHGMVRADGHEIGFILYTMLLGLSLPQLCFPGRKWHWFNLAALMSLIALEIVRPGQIAASGKDWRNRFVENSKTISHLTTLPSLWQEQFSHAAHQADLPSTRRIIGTKSVDVFNYDQGVALLNGFNYTPRPVFQSYSAYTPRLMSRNLRFYQSPQAPDYVLWRQGSIDYRYPTTDDALIVAELPRSYKLVQEEGPYLLLEKQSSVPQKQLERNPFLSRSMRLREVLTLPPVPDQVIWFQARLKLSKLGRLRAFLYKPPLVNLIVTDEDGAETAWRLIPRIAEKGFLLSPLLENQEDFASFMRGHGNKWLRSLRFETPSKQKEFWARDEEFVVINLSTLPGLRLDGRPDFSGMVTSGITNIPPTSAKSSVAMERFQIGSTRAMLFHAPASLTFQVPANFRHFRGTFGIRDGAIEGPAHTDGVEFVVEAQASDGRKSVLWRRFLDPLHEARDRGPQSFSIELPPGAANQITLRALPGPRNDANWDCSYVANLEFSPAAISP